MISAILPDSDSEDELPPGWEERVTLDGLVYYVNHATKGTQWNHPRTGKKKRVSGDLPPNWERVIENNTVVFIDHSTRRKTYTDPRLAFAIEEKENKMDIRQKFDGSTTALQVLHGMDLSGKTIVITGATSGIGFETAKSLARHGAKIILCGRTKASCKAAERKILMEYPEAKLYPVEMDLSNLVRVKRAADFISSFHRQLDVIILNAGIMGVGYVQTVDKIESVFQVNHLAHYYLIKALRQELHRGSRIVILSSESHRFSNINKSNISKEKLSPSSPRGYWDMMAYNNSKFCNILFATELHRRWGHTGIDVFVVHPGNLISTNLSRYSCFYRLLFALVRPFTKSLQQGAATTVYAAVSPELTGSGGIYLNNCCPCEVRKDGRDEQLARKLWELSEGFVAAAFKRLCHEPDNFERPF